MKIKEIKINNFKRFTDLTIKDIPESAKLIVLVGPNGSGKTSLFEAFNFWHRLKAWNNYNERKGYLEKVTNGSSNVNQSFDADNKVKIEFHTPIDKNIRQEIKGKFYFRTAYRNEPDFTIDSLHKQNSPIEQGSQLGTLMESDATVSKNYQRLIAETVSEIYNETNDKKNVKTLREELIGKIQNSLANIFDDLNLSSIGNPLSNGSFYFEKGISKDFHYKNLSAGEKSVFDLVLDIIMKANYYSDAVFCIDEPEVHMHTKLQAKVLKELFNLVPTSSQLWVSTHSIGMLKQAEEIEKANPGTVVFLDFNDKDFDTSEIIKPTIIDKAIWDKFFELAFAEFSQLIAPKTIVFCEGTPEGRKYKNFDAQIYSKIFWNRYHDTKFISIGSCSEIEKIDNPAITVVNNILNSSKILKFVDRDDKSSEEVAELLDKGIKTSKRRHIECYLLDDEIIGKLCDSEGKPELLEKCLQAKHDALQDSRDRGKPRDDIKSASGTIYTKLKEILSLTGCGNNKCAFLRDTIAELVTEETNIYKELEKEIFG